MTSRDGLILGVLALIAAAFRFAALGHGLPFSPGLDERQVMAQAVRMMETGDFNPYSYDNPALLLSLHAAVATARLLAGSLTGLWVSLEQSVVADFYLWSRAVTAAIGTATIVVAYQLGSRFGRVGAFTAALLIAVQPDHIRESHHVLVDVPSAFLVTLTMLLAVRASEQKTTAAFAWAGVAAGLSAAMTSIGTAAALMPLVALGLLRAGLPRVKTLAALVASTVGVFLVWVPYGVLGPPVVRGGLAEPVGAEPALTLGLSYLRAGLGVAGLALALAAVIVGIVASFRAAGPRRVVWATGVSFVVGCSTLVFFRQGPVSDREWLSLIPPLSVLAGGTVAALFEWTAVRRLGRRWQVATATVLVALVTVAPARQATDFVSTIARTSSHELAYSWILDNVPAGSQLAVEHGLVLPARYDARPVERVTDRTYADYERAGVEYLVTTSATGTLAHRNLLRGMELLVTFAPTAEHPGSEIRVYRMLR